MDVVPASYLRNTTFTKTALYKEYNFQSVSDREKKKEKIMLKGNKKDCDIMVAAMQHIVEHQQTEEHQLNTSAQAVQPKRSILQDIQSQTAATSKVPSSTDALSLVASLGNHDNTTGNAKMHYQAGKYCTITFQDSKTAALAVFQYDDHFVEKFGSTISVKILPRGVPLPDVRLSPLSTLTDSTSACATSTCTSLCCITERVYLKAEIARLTTKLKHTQNTYT
ncbi:unnamed protein product, partial [Didymodactylos carnosus]